jgi:alpha-mannosidase
LRTARLSAFHAEVNDLAVALHAVIDLAIDLQEGAPQRPRLFAALEDCANQLAIDDVRATAPRARAALDKVLASGNPGSPHRIVATGHAHLDTAWLWPIRETRRKAVRTFANAVDLLRRNPDAVYCHSQAQHYAWVKESAPELFEEVVELVRLGRWEPVGGMWVETDLNLPDGESLLRQLVQGQRAFKEWFGVTCDGAFLPDDFGYPGGLPQIVAHGGCSWFFTQKLSWNETNKFPHHTFWWEGIDGTAVFTHFSPVDTYNAILTPSQLRFAERNFSDHVGSSTSLVLYGHGDGGGGPTQTMIDRGRLAHDLEGVPRVSFGTVRRFFDDARAEYGANAPRWVGEMYFEKHRGTYSTQVGTKQGNRCSERLLHELELWSVAAGIRPPVIDELWQRVLTQQFHDIIPGSSIAWVHHDAEEVHGEVADVVETLLARIIPARGGDIHVMNPAPVAVKSVIDIDGDARWVDAPAFGPAAPASVLPDNVTPVSVTATDNGWTIDNGLIAVTIGHDGALTSIVRGSRDLLPSTGGPEFVLRRDTPAEYDAWDIDMADANSPVERTLAAEATALVESGPLRAVIESTYSTESSRFVVRHTVRAGAPMFDVTMDADWHEREKRLQWRLPTDLRSLDAVCGTQFGHVRRARHANTSWDVARFEVCAHRYVAVNEPSFGAAILADGPHGYDVRGDALCLTLLRSPRFPDPEADQGRHTLEWSVMLTDGDAIVGGIEEVAATITHPVRIADGTPGLEPVGVSIDALGVLISAVKPSDDSSGDVIIRVWESRGGRTRGTLTLDPELGSRVLVCDALENTDGRELTRLDEDRFEFELRPFEIVTFRATSR